MASTTALIPQTIEDLEAILCKRLEATPKQFQHAFEVEQRADDNFVIQLRTEWVDKNAWLVVNDYVREQKGQWDSKVKQWIIPYRMDSKDSYKESPTPMHIDEESPSAASSDEYNLRLSKEKLGELIPILTDAHGNVIDGFHRERLDPKWYRVKAEHVVDPVQLSMARLAANVCRRQVPAEEKTKLLTNIAELTGWDVNEIAEALGMSEKWVRQYLPSEYKNKEMATLAHQRFANRESQDTSLASTDNDTTEEPSFESQSITPIVPVEKIDSGFVFECPECDRKFHLIHVNPSGKHLFEEDKLL